MISYNYNIPMTKLNTINLNFRSDNLPQLELLVGPRWVSIFASSRGGKGELGSGSSVGNKVCIASRYFFSSSGLLTQIISLSI